MRCAIRPLFWLAGLVLSISMTLAFTSAAASATEADEADEGDANDLETTVEEEGGLSPEEDLLSSQFDESDGAGALELQEGKVTFALQGADVRDFCNWFAERLEINIVLSPKVMGPMNISLTNVPWETALRKALKTHGYVLTVDENGIYTVITQEEVAAEPLQTEIYSLSYASAKQAAEIVKPLLTADRGTVQYDVDSNQLVVTDVPAKLADVERVLVKLDRQIAQVQIEVKLVEKTSTDGSDLGIKWSSLESYAVGASSIKRTYSHDKLRTDRNLIYTNEAWSQQIEPTRGLETRTVGGSRVTGDPELAIPLEEVVKDVTKTLILSASDFSIVFSALLREDNTELISSPSVTTVDNRTATINVTRLLPIPKYTYNEETGSYEISDFSEKEVGIKLEITPQVNQDDYITMDVRPELSTQFGNQVFVISGSEITIPIIDTRNASTRVIVKSSETLVIGGLTSTDETISVTRVPVLSSIPIVGNLFKHKATDKVKTDLLIFITPTLVKGAADES
ncbi:MAG: hypothetical protein JW889_15540 [Verrucomicrobia bacterium]|nr:hypothetical protein [Verrucomicrobiota bacterium]